MVINRTNSVETAMFRGQLFIFFIICIRNSSCVIDALYETGRELWKFESMLIDKLKLNTTIDFWVVSELLAGETATYREIKNQLDEVDNQLSRVEASTIPKTIRESFKLSLSDIMLEKAMDTIDLFVSSIDELYEEFREHMKKSNPDLNHPLRVLLRRAFLSVDDKMFLIRKIVIYAKELLPDSKNLVDAIVDYATTRRPQLCDGPHMISNVLIQLFRIVVIAEVKAIILLAFANIHRYPQHVDLINLFTRDAFEKQFGTYVNLFSLNIDAIDGVYMRACDPEGGIWIRGKSFHELERTSQAIIFQYHWARCSFPTCNDISSGRQDLCDPKYYDERSGCASRSTECAYLGAMQACVLKTGPYKFQYVNSTELGLLGRNFECPKNSGYIIEDGTGLKSIYATCACNCYGNENKVCLSIMESRVKKNMVITGLRFFRKDQILYIQAREGKLDANGVIFRYSEGWIPLPHIEASRIHSIDRDNKIFFLDDVHLPPNFVLTGVKLSKVRRGTVTGFAIKIYGVPFDYKSGQLDTEKVIQISPQVSKDSAGDGLSFEAVNSMYTRLPHTPTPEAIKYVSLERSRLRDDFGQSTLPLFDAVPITFHAPSLLGGIGIFHKGVEGYAGFISLRVYPINYAKYFSDFKNDYVIDGRVLFNKSQSN